MLGLTRPPIRADWFSGSLDIDQGEALSYRHSGRGYLFERL